MLYTFGNLAALGIARCSRGRNHNVSWLPVSYVTLVAAVTFLVGLAADAVAIRVFVVEFLALSIVDCFHFICPQNKNNP